MATVNFSSNDILVAEANILYAPKGTALPDETTVAWNTFTDWDAAWKHLGYTAEAARIGYNYDTFELEVEQTTQPVIQRKVSERFTIDFTLAQFDGTNLALVTGGTATNTAAGASQKAYTKVVAGGDTNLGEYLFALEGYRPDANGTKQPVRIFVHRATIRLNGNIQFSKNAGTTVPVQITGLADTGKAVGQQLFEAHIITAPATS